MFREIATSMDGVHCFDSCLSIPIRRCVRERDIGLHNVLSLRLGMYTHPLQHLDAFFRLAGVFPQRHVSC